MNSQECGTEPASAPLFGALEALGRRNRSVALLAGAGAALAAALGGAVLAGWTDLLLDLSGGVRALLMLAALATGIALWVRRSRNAARAPERLAAQLDRHGATGGALLAATELALALPADPVSRSLALEAASRAGKSAGEIQPEDVVPTRTARPAWAAAGGVAGFLLLAALLWPGLVGAQALRLLDPFGDHPPYSPYAFELDPGHARVFFGDPFALKVTASGDRLPARLDWVVEREGGPAVVYPLLDQGEGRFAGTVAAVEHPFAYFVRAPDGRSGRRRVDVIHTPRLEGVEVRVEPPAYTRKTPWSGKYPEGGLAAVKRTRVTITAASNRPLAAGSITWKDGSVLELKPAAGPSGKTDRVVGSFEVGKDATFELRFSDPEGNALREPFAGRVTLIADRRPSVAILEPPAESYATPTALVPVAIEAEDDFGFTRAALFRSLNGSRDRALELTLPSEPAPPLRTGTVLQLKDWGLEPGDVIELYAVVADNDPDGAKSAQSKVHRLAIISEEEFQAAMRNQQRIEDLMEKYAPVQEALDRAREEAKKLEEALEKAERSTGQEAEDAKKAAEEALKRMNEALADAETKARELAGESPVFDVDRQFKKDLEDLAKELEEMKKGSKDGLEELAKELSKPGAGAPKPGSPGRKAASELRKKLEGAAEEHEEQVRTPLEELEKIYRLMEFEARFTALALAQEDLARRTARFGDREKIEDPEEREQMRALAEEQRGLETELTEVLQGIRDAASRLPKGEPYDKLREEAEEFAAALVEAKAPQVLEQAERSLIDRLGKKSAEDTRKAADLLMSFVQRCEGMGEQAGKACLKFQPGLSQAMQGTLNQLLEGMGLPGMSSGQKSGAGMAGAGGKSNAQRGGPSNRGLYGSRPAASRSSGGGRGRADGGAGARTLTGGAAGAGSAGEGRTDLLYGGVPIQALPGEYRAAVREFFRRIAEESGR